MSAANPRASHITVDNVYDFVETESNTLSKTQAYELRFSKASYPLKETNILGACSQLKEVIKNSSACGFAFKDFQK